MSAIIPPEYIQQCREYIVLTDYGRTWDLKLFYPKDIVHLAHKIHITKLVCEETGNQYAIEDLEKQLPLLLSQHRTLTHSRYKELLIYGNNGNFSIDSVHIYTLIRLLSLLLGVEINIMAIPKEYLRECGKYIESSPYKEKGLKLCDDRNVVYLAHQIHLTKLVSKELSYAYDIEELDAQLPLLLTNHVTLTRHKYNELLVYGNSNNFTIRSSHLLID